MHFDERTLKPYGEPVAEGELVEGKVYFSLGFVDEDMLIPVLQPIVFVGRETDDENQVCFQDIDSYRRGVRRNSGAKDEDATAPNHIYEYERALDQLILCFLRRRRVLDGEVRAGLCAGFELHRV